MSGSSKATYDDITDFQRRGAVMAWKRSAIDAAKAALSEREVSVMVRHNVAMAILRSAAVKIERHEPVHWVGDAPTSLHGNGAASFARTTREVAEVTCRLCLTLLAREQRCHGDRDGDCDWESCPQIRDVEPAATGRHCPLDTEDGR